MISGLKGEIAAMLKRRVGSPPHAEMAEDSRAFPFSQAGRYTSLLVEIAKLRGTLSQGAG